MGGGLLLGHQKRIKKLLTHQTVNVMGPGCEQTEETWNVGMRGSAVGEGGL